MGELYKRLAVYGESDYYPCHMPGHKRRLRGCLPEEIVKADITEIEGFDNLHEPRDLLKRLQEKAAVLYGAEESFFLINGSTGGILSAVSAALPCGGHILMARNSHRSVYHAVYLRQLKATYLYPAKLPPFSLYDAITPEQVAEALEREADIGAVLIVSPTYEGRIADVRGIARVVHERGLPLLVDEAHGAHLGLAEGFAENSVQAGADIVIHSVHKTLPALTQSALLHVSGDRVDRERLRRFLHIYQSSSPSYLLMAGIDNALEVTEREGKTLFPCFLQRYREMMTRLSECVRLRFLPWEPERQDVGKLVVDTGRAGISGQQLYDILLDKYHIQPEMAAPDYCLAMFTVSDTEEGYSRMTEALLEIDRELSAHGGSPVENAPSEDFGQAPDAGAIPIASAWDGEWEYVALERAAGRYAAEFVNLYPPGVPILAPGEIFTDALCERLRGYAKLGLCVQGAALTEQGCFVKCLKGGGFVPG